ncbi:hypothetical protein AR457_01385 [Streptomyces agglomeratus]|nr:hypothetical protein AR457_01385 [Streptomyces agglomeratus]OEJ63555.1 hypothetical protein BGM19_35295 [Streptomyces agglomeratus]
MTTSPDGATPHPHIGGRAAALRALAAWRMEWPGTPRVIVLTGDSGSGCSRLLTGFLMMCDPEFRKQMPLDSMDPSTVPPELPAPTVPNPAWLTAAQFLWLLADHCELSATTTDEVFTQLAARDQPLTIAVPNVDRAGPVRAAEEPARLVREVLNPLASIGTIRLLADVPRSLVAELLRGLPSGVVQVIDLDEPEWADPEGLVLHAEAALSPRFGAPELQFTRTSVDRRRLAELIGRRAGTSPLVVELAAQSILMVPEGFDPADEDRLPTSVGGCMDLHAERLGVEPGILRVLLAPLALAEGGGLPVELWAPLAGAVAGRDVSRDIAGAMQLVGPFILASGTGQNGDPTLLRLRHPAIGDDIRARLRSVGAAQSRIAMALLAAVPGQDWSKAEPYLRDHIAGHTLDAGLLPQLLTDPGLFVHADPVALRTAVEAVPIAALGAPARTYLRIAPLLTRTEVPVPLRAALLEIAFVEDGLPEYADAIRNLGFDLPWRTLWSLRVSEVKSVRIGNVPLPEGARAPVAVLIVPAETPGARPVAQVDDDGGTVPHGVIVHSLGQPVPDLGEIDPEQVLRPSQAELSAAPLALSRGTDYVRVWDRASGKVVAALISDSRVLSADLSPAGVLVLASARGVTALQIRPASSATAT